MSDPNSGRSNGGASEKTALERQLEHLASAFQQMPIPRVGPGRELDALRANADQADLLLARIAIVTDTLREAGVPAAWSASDPFLARALLADLALTAANFRWLSGTIRTQVDKAKKALEEAARYVAAQSSAPGGTDVQAGGAPPGETQGDTQG